MEKFSPNLPNATRTYALPRIRHDVLGISDIIFWVWQVVEVNQSALGD